VKICMQCNPKSNTKLNPNPNFDPKTNPKTLIYRTLLKKN